MKGESEMKKTVNVEVLPDDIHYESDYAFKVIMLGDTYVGKTSIISKGLKRVNITDYHPTLGLEFCNSNFKVEDKTVSLRVWDTCGQEIYRSLLKSYFRCASLAIIVFSITDHNSFLNLNQWIKDVRTKSSPNCHIFLIGHKADLEEKREVSRELIEKYKQMYGIEYYRETSIYDEYSTSEIFTEVAKFLYKEQMNYKKYSQLNKKQMINKIRITKSSVYSKQKLYPPSSGCCKN